MGSNIIDEIDCSSFFDHFDDLIDFPADTECGGDGLNSGDLTDFSSLWDNTLPETTPLFPENKNSASDLSTEIAVPYEDIVQLEWLSTFVEESFADGGLTIPVENSVVVKNEPTEPPPAAHAAQFQTSSPISVLESSASSGSSCSVTLGSGPAKRGPQRARSKRPRPATFNPRAAMIHLVNPETQGVENFAESKPIKKPKTEKKKKTPLEVTNPTGTLRKCLHCEITKTPQWRAGPMGPKTLCNACGVRYKSGRLFPEYRPAASPTFVPTLHSNSHKKVIEMRVKVTEIPSPTPKVTEIPSPTPKVAEPELVVPVTSAAPPALAPALE